MKNGTNTHIVWLSSSWQFSTTTYSRLAYKRERRFGPKLKRRADLMGEFGSAGICGIQPQRTDRVVGSQFACRTERTVLFPDLSCLGCFVRTLAAPSLPCCFSVCCSRPSLWKTCTNALRSCRCRWMDGVHVGIFAERRSDSRMAPLTIGGGWR